MIGISRRNSKMIFEYRSDHNLNDEKDAIKKPKIDIVLRKSPDPVNSSTNPEFRAFGLVDSGADISFIPRGIARILCLDLDDTTIKTTMSASGKFSTYRTTMHVQITYKEHRVNVGMIDAAVPQTDLTTQELARHILIGRRGFFDK